MTTEQWRPIPGYEGRYDVSDQGRVRSHHFGGRILQLRPNQQGYLTVELWAGNRGKRQRVHVLVALAFLGPRPDGMEVRHLNDVKDDARLANLAYGDHSTNMLDCVALGNHSQARKTHCPSGHAYDEENTRWRSIGGRACRACQRARDVIAKQRRAERLALTTEVA